MPILTSDMSVVDGLGYSVLGIAIVFAALIVLWAVIAIMAKVLGSGKKTPDAKQPAAAASAAPAAVPAPASAAVPAPGTAGEVVLKNVSEKDAALIMAIVANKLQKPLNELRFKSITEVK